MPDDLDQRSCTPTKHEQVAAMRIALQALLNLQGQPLHALAHVRVAHRDPDPRARWDHRSAFNAAETSVAGADEEMRTCRPLQRSTVIAAHGS